MALYKYCNEAGKFILQNLEIKVTPPNELNDVCEMRPVVKNRDPKAWAREFAKKVVTDPTYYNAHPLKYPNCKNFREFQAFARSQLGTIISDLEKHSPAVDAELQEEVVELVSQKWGIFSLSANPVQHLMWAHYGDSHRGIVVEFNETDKIFNHASFLRCEYNNTPAMYDSSAGVNQAAVELFARRKRTDWSYEEESRLIVPFSLCRPATNGSSKIYLFAIEPQAILSVTFGLRTPDSLKNEVAAALSRPEFAQVTKWQITQGPTPLELQRIRFS
jgi:hypothetical protein